jgi:deoxyribonucleoside regulator
MVNGHVAHRRGTRSRGVLEGEARRSILTEVATLYYVDRFNQEQIASQVSRSVSTVSRLLAEAEAAGIVEVRVRQPTAVAPDLQAALGQRFGLRVVRVLRTSAEEPRRLVEQLGDLAARYLSTILVDGAVLSVGWGTSIYEVVRAINPGPHQEILVAQALGSLGGRLPAIDNPQITRILAERVGGTPYFLPAPMIVESGLVRDALLQDSQLRETLALGRRSDIALVGIGLADPEHSGMYRAGYIDAATLESIRATGVVGDIMVEFFDQYGQVQDLDVSKRVVGMRLADLRDVRTVIAVAGGIIKAPAILGALRTGLIHVLVTDDATARRVLELADVYPAPERSGDDARLAQRW